MIPIKLREELGLKTGQEYYFFIHEEEGRKYVCIDCGPTITSESLEKAMQIVQQSGMRIVQSND